MFYVQASGIISPKKSNAETSGFDLFSFLCLLLPFTQKGSIHQGSASGTEQYLSRTIALQLSSRHRSCCADKNRGQPAALLPRDPSKCNTTCNSKIRLFPKKPTIWMHLPQLIPQLHNQWNNRNESLRLEKTKKNPKS